MKKILFSALSLIACLSFQSCSEEEIMYYEGGNAVHFLESEKSKSMTFITQPDLESATLQLPVQLIGNIQDKDLTFSVEVINDEERTTATPDQYEIVSCTIPSGETMGYVTVKVKNPDKINSASKTLKLGLKLVDNEQVKAGGWSHVLTADLLWSSDYVKPGSWTGFYYYVCQKFSPAMYKAYIAATGYTEFYWNSSNKDPELGRAWIQTEMYGISKKFGDWIRKWNEEHFPEVYCHDGDYEYAGTPVVPLW